MQVVNVLETINNTPTRVWSYVVLFETDSHRIPAIRLAEDKFLSLVRERMESENIKVDSDNISYLLEDGLFDDDNDGYQLAIIWSEPLN